MESGKLLLEEPIAVSQIRDDGGFTKVGNNRDANINFIIIIIIIISTSVSVEKKQNQWIAGLLIDLSGECEENESEMTQHLGNGLNNKIDFFILRDGERD